MANWIQSVPCPSSGNEAGNVWMRIAPAIITIVSRPAGSHTPRRGTRRRSSAARPKPASTLAPNAKRNRWRERLRNQE
ncbi:MAG: hypothetical protein DMF88_25490 [Acidobacteria bacterium]|nr:MAG: hypothetical protein DMF88_25490 [Acidobacteriota bacterium]